MGVSRTPCITSDEAAAIIHKRREYVLCLIRRGLFHAQKQTAQHNSRWIIDMKSFETFLASLEGDKDEYT